MLFLSLLWFQHSYQEKCHSEKAIGNNLYHPKFSCSRIIINNILNVNHETILLHQNAIYIKRMYQKIFPPGVSSPSRNIPVAITNNSNLTLLHLRTWKSNCGTSSTNAHLLYSVINFYFLFSMAVKK